MSNVPFRAVTPRDVNSTRRDTPTGPPSPRFPALLICSAPVRPYRGSPAWCRGVPLAPCLLCLCLPASSCLPPCARWPSAACCPAAGPALRSEKPTPGGERPASSAGRGRGGGEAGGKRGGGPAGRGVAYSSILRRRVSRWVRVAPVWVLAWGCDAHSAAATHAQCAVVTCARRARPQQHTGTSRGERARATRRGEGQRSVRAAFSSCCSHPCCGLAPPARSAQFVLLLSFARPLSVSRCAPFHLQRHVITLFAPRIGMFARRVLVRTRVRRLVGAHPLAHPAHGEQHARLPHSGYPPRTSSVPVAHDTCSA
jgi:hypothetical protein